MTYTPLWSQEAAHIRDTVAKVADVPKEQQDALRNLSDWLAHTMEGDFPDLDREIVGWVAIRLAAHQCALWKCMPNAGAATFLLLGLLAGDHLVERAS